MTEDTAHEAGHGGVRGLTPADIFHREFRKVLVGGYDTGEVDDFLERVGSTLESLIARIEMIEERDRDQREQLAAYRLMEQTLQDTLTTSQKFSGDILDAAKREADSLREEARLIRARAQFEASRLPIEIREDMKRLQEQRARLRAEMTAILDTHRNLLNKLIPAEERLADEVLAVEPDEMPSEMVDENTDDAEERDSAE